MIGHGHIAEIRDAWLDPNRVLCPNCKGCINLFNPVTCRRCDDWHYIPFKDLTEDEKEDYVPCPACVDSSTLKGEGCGRCLGLGHVHIAELTTQETEVWFGPQP